MWTGQPGHLSFKFWDSTAAMAPPTPTGTGRVVIMSLSDSEMSGGRRKALDKAARPAAVMIDVNCILGVMIAADE